MQAERMRVPRVIPWRDYGIRSGIRLFCVRPDSLLGTLGFENGDRIQKINGINIANPNESLNAYARLRNARRLVVQVCRRGRNVKLRFSIK